MSERDTILHLRTAAITGRLPTQFTRADFGRVCPHLAAGTIRNFLRKHSVGNRDGNTELFRQHPDGTFSLLSLSG